MIRRRAAYSTALAISTGLVLGPYCGQAFAQTPFQDVGGPRPVRVRGGLRGTRMAVAVHRQPAAGDSIRIITNTSRIRAELILPDGRRIGEAGSPSSGFQWMRFPNLLPLASDDGGYQIEVTFTKPAAAGGYAIQFTSDHVETGAFAKAWFTSRMLEFQELVRSLPGGQIAKPALLGSGAPARIDVKTEVEKAWFVVAVPNPSVDVTLTLPSGRILRRADAVGREWEVFNDPDGGFLRDILFPLIGTHHLIALSKADAGTYLIRAGAPAGTTGELHAAFVPLGALANSPAFGRQRGDPSPGEVAMRLSAQSGFVGDPVEVTVRLKGDVGAEPLEFVVRTETQPYLGAVPPEQGGGRRVGPAGAVQTVPVTFHQDSDGDYRGALTLREAGWTRVAVRVKGRKASGRPFDMEEMAGVSIDEIVARVAAFQAEGKDANQDGLFETLEVALDLDVIVPGSYMISAGVSDAAKQGGPSTVVTRQLEKGRQRIVVSLPSGQIWNRLRSGPLVAEMSVSLNLGGSYILVPGGQHLSQEIEYRREQWDPGVYHSDDAVTVHGIRPAASGRYAIAEVIWEASTPGGPCALQGYLSDQKNEHSLFDQHSQTVPSGTRKFSFLFDGAGIAAAGTRDWRFTARVSCGDRKDFVIFPLAPLVVNSEEYEALRGAFQLAGEVALSQTSPRYWQEMLTANGDGADSAQFEVTKLPAGWKGNFYPLLKGRNSNAVNLIVETPSGLSPGRYFLEVAIASGSRRASREFVVEVIESVP